MLETLWAKPEEASALIHGDYILLGVAQAGTPALQFTKQLPPPPPQHPHHWGEQPLASVGAAVLWAVGFEDFLLLNFAGLRNGSPDYIRNPLSWNSAEMNWLLYSPGPRLEKCPTNKYQLIWGLSTWFTSTLLPYRDGKGIPGQCVGSYWQAQTYFRGRVRHSHPESLQILETARTVQRQKAKVNTKTVNEEWTQRGDILLWK